MVRAQNKLIIMCTRSLNTFFLVIHRSDFFREGESEHLEILANVLTKGRACLFEAFIVSDTVGRPS